MDGSYKLKYARIKSRLTTNAFIVDDVDANINNIK
jgi:hypothetical protein